MRNKAVLKDIIARMAAILVFSALCVLAFLLASGAVKIKNPFGDASEGSGKQTADTYESIYIPDSIAEPTAPPDDTSSVPGSDGPDGTADSAPSTDEPTTAPAVIAYPSLSEVRAQGYRVTYAPWNDGMKLSLVFENGDLPSFMTLNHKKTEETKALITYQEDGIEFPSSKPVTTDRRAVEVYMGYILVDTGKGTCTDIIGTVTEKKAEDGTVTVIRSERKILSGVDTLTVYSSSGDVIGTYPADRVHPAYTRDTSDRALFKYNSKYYYIDEKTGDFLESDYNDETDNRGLYFDYNPSYGKSDCNLKKYCSEADVEFTYIIDTSSYYAANQVDWRIAKELTLANPTYAATVARRNYPFQNYYNVAVKEIRAEQATSAAVTTLPEEPASTPGEVTEQPGTPGDVTTGLSPAESVPQAPANAAQPEEISVPDTLPLSPEDTSVPGTGTGDETGTDTPADASSSDETSSSPDETTPEETTQDPHITVVRRYGAYRYTFAAKEPVPDDSRTTTKKYTGNTKLSQNIDGIISWNNQYPYARAYNFSEGRAVTVDDTGIIRIVDTRQYQWVYLNIHYYAETHTGTQTHAFYTEPFWRGVDQLGHFYYDNGLLRIRRVESPYNIAVLINAKDVLIDLDGNVFDIPAGFTLYAYSEGILVLERDGVFALYHKDGYWVKQPEYRSAQPFVEGLCVLGKADAEGNTVYGLVDKNGREVLPFIYDSISNASTGVIAAHSAEHGWQVFAKTAK